MAVITKTYTFVPNTTAHGSEVNRNFDNIYTEFNGGIDSANLKVSSVTRTRINTEIVAAGPDTTVSVSSIGGTPVPAAHVSITTTGKPVFVTLSGTSATAATVVAQANGNSNYDASLILRRNESQIMVWPLTWVQAASSTASFAYVPSSFNFVDTTISAGSHSYDLAIRINNSANRLVLINVQLLAYEWA